MDTTIKKLTMKGVAPSDSRMYGNVLTPGCEPIEQYETENVLMICSVIPHFLLAQCCRHPVTLASILPSIATRNVQGVASLGSHRVSRCVYHSPGQDQQAAKKMKKKTHGTQVGIIFMDRLSAIAIAFRQRLMMKITVRLTCRKPILRAGLRIQISDMAAGNRSLSTA